MSSLRCPPKLRTHPNSSSSFSCCLLPEVHFPQPYLHHLPKLYLTAGLALPEGRAGTTWDLQSSKLLRFPSSNDDNECIAFQYTPTPLSLCLFLSLFLSLSLSPSVSLSLCLSLSFSLSVSLSFSLSLCLSLSLSLSLCVCVSLSLCLFLCLSLSLFLSFGHQCVNDF